MGAADKRERSCSPQDVASLDRSQTCSPASEPRNGAHERRNKKNPLLVHKHSLVVTLRSEATIMQFVSSRIKSLLEVPFSRHFYTNEASRCPNDHWCSSLTFREMIYFWHQDPPPPHQRKTSTKLSVAFWGLRRTHGRIKTNRGRTFPSETTNAGSLKSMDVQRLDS